MQFQFPNIFHCQEQYQDGFAGDAQQRQIKILESMGLTHDEIQDGLKSPKFLKACSQILSPGMFSVPRERKLECLRQIVNTIRQQFVTLTPVAKKRKSRRNENLGTTRRLAVFCLLSTDVPISMERLIADSGLCERAIRTFLGQMSKEGYVVAVRDGKKILYRLSILGVEFFHTRMITIFADGEFEMGMGASQLLAKIRTLESVVSGLRALGWWSQSISRALKRWSVDQIRNTLLEIKQKMHLVKDVGAYLYTVLLKRYSESRQITKVTEAILTNCPAWVKERFLDHVLGVVTPKQALHAANMVHKQYFAAPDEFFPGKIITAINFVLKRKMGCTMQ